MKRVLTIALATAAFGFAAATPAQAAELIFCGSGSSCLSGTTNVNLVTATNVASGTGNVGIGGPGVTFTSGQGNINLDASGQATISSAVSTELTQLTFTMAPGFSFTAAEFNLFSGDPKSFNVVLTTSTGVTQSLTLSNANGSNWFDIIANLPGETFISASFSSTAGATDGGFLDFRQLRLTLGNGLQPMPEPATWGMMLLGFAGIGMAVRRRRSSALMQVA
jgi:hypothetical protein